MVFKRFILAYLFALIILLPLPFYSLQAQTNRQYAGDYLFQYIGKAKNNADVKDWIDYLGVPQSMLSSDKVYTYSTKGIRIGFYKQQIVERIMLYNDEYSSKGIKFQAFKGALPLGIAFGDTKASIENKIGKADRNFSKYLHYDKNKPVKIVLHFDGTTQDAKLQALMLEFKSCVQGDCENGYGVYVDIEGWRYEGNWRNGKKHGEGTLHNLIYNTQKEGIWELGEYKGKNYFKDNQLYNLLGKHQSSNDMIKLAESYGSGYQKVALAYDYAKYVFENNKLRVYFNDYGYAYKISLHKSGFKDFPNHITQKLNAKSNHAQVRYVLGAPYKQESTADGSVWYYQEGKYELKITFDNLKIIETIELKIRDEDSLYRIEKGMCKNGDCQNGYGEYICEAGRYLGDFQNGKFHGEGQMFYKSGGIYKGSFQQGERHGEGVYIWSDQSRYKGQWAKNKRNGRGTMLYRNKGRYEGEWEDNQRQGRGIMHYPNGDRYTGEWHQNLQQGTGTIRYMDGTRESGEWKLGKLQNKFK
ncbi:MAG: hypothetical protein JJT94_10580 [Bernardetiaceae bacterium]|nr:hypothetical protein [Bernardetiaceae bacterium]